MMVKKKGGGAMAEKQKDSSNLCGEKREGRETEGQAGNDLLKR